MAEPARRPQSQPAGAGSGGLDCLAPSKGGSGTRPQTAQVRMPEAPRAARAAFRPPVSRPQSTSSIRPGSTAGFDPALTARTPPWVFTQSVDPLSNLMLKKEYMAMADKAREDELFVQKLNKHNPPPQVTHMKKDWRYYQHCGSKGNVWSDLHMTPEDRRHLVVTPTVLKGYDVQMRTVAKHLHAEEEAKAARLEKVAYERNVRRFRLTEQVKAREVLEVRASQRPATAEYRAAQQGEFGQDDAAFPEGMASGTRPTAQESRPATAHAASKAWQAQQAVEDAAPTGPGDGEHEENPAAAAHLSSMALHDDAGGGPCPVYGVHIDYPVEYDFNAMGSGLEREDTITAPGCGRRMGRGGGACWRRAAAASRAKAGAATTCNLVGAVETLAQRRAGGAGAAELGEWGCGKHAYERWRDGLWPGRAQVRGGASCFSHAGAAISGFCVHDNADGG